MNRGLPSIVICRDLNSTAFDAILVMAPDIENISHQSLRNPLKLYNSKVGRNVGNKNELIVVPVDLPANKLIFSGTGIAYL